MPRFVDLNLIRIFDFYLASMFLISFVRRWQVYLDGILLVVAIRTRWPRLLSRLNHHRTVVLNWPTLRPAALALALTITQMIASRLIWPQATMRIGELINPWWELVILLIGMTPMLIIDTYFLIRIGSFDRTETEKYFDMAERWAGTIQAKLVRAVTLGYVDPSRMVEDELRKGLEQLRATVSWSMWWVSCQISARLLCGLTIWMLWATYG